MATTTMNMNTMSVEYSTEAYMYDFNLPQIEVSQEKYNIMVENCLRNKTCSAWIYFSNVNNMKRKLKYDKDNNRLIYNGIHKQQTGEIAPIISREQPPAIFFDDEYINQLIVEEKQLVINELKTFHKNPFYLKTNDKHISSTTRFSVYVNIEKKDEFNNLYCYENTTTEKVKELYNLYNVKSETSYYDNFDEFIKETHNKDLYVVKYRFEFANTYTKKEGSKETEFAIYHLYKEIYHYCKKGSKLRTNSDIETYKYSTDKFTLNPRCFNIIDKEFKLMQESKRDYYTTYFTNKPFFQFEECGIEVLYARKGYSIDGKRLPSFNRGSVYGLKYSLKQNKIKQMGLTKKDDIIKVLMKI